MARRFADSPETGVFTTRRPFFDLHSPSAVVGCAVVLAAGSPVVGAAAGPDGGFGYSGCRLTHLITSFGPEVSEATGQGTLIVRLTNKGPTCVLRGYPLVAFYDRIGRIPFRIHDGGDQMITSKPPRSVVVHRFGAAFVAFNKFRCDLGVRRTAALLRLRLPAPRSGAVQIGLLRGRAMPWCGPGDPGSTIDVTPFEPTIQATRR